MLRGLGIFERALIISNRHSPFNVMSIQIVQAIHERLGFHPGRVLLLKARTFPKTYNSKVQHARLRQLYLDGNLKGHGQILYPEY